MGRIMKFSFDDLTAVHVSHLERLSPGDVLPCWIQLRVRDGSRLVYHPVVLKRVGPCFADAFRGLCAHEGKVFYVSNYGTHWRCWYQKPDRFRLEQKWEDEVSVKNDTF